MRSRLSWKSWEGFLPFPRWFAAGRAGRLPTRLGHLRALLTLLVAISGCVVPVGPEWTDPPSNTPPTISSADPAVGSLLELDADGGAPPEVVVELADQNTQDKLYARWIIDYPPYQVGISRVVLTADLPGGNQIRRGLIRYRPNCSDDRISHDFANHRLLLAVSDGPFAIDDISQPPFEKVKSGKFLVEGSWEFVLGCQ